MSGIKNVFASSRSVSEQMTKITFSRGNRDRFRPIQPFTFPRDSPRCPCQIRRLHFRQVYRNDTKYNVWCRYKAFRRMFSRDCYICSSKGQINSFSFRIKNMDCLPRVRSTVILKKKRKSCAMTGSIRNIWHQISFS